MLPRAMNLVRPWSALFSVGKKKNFERVNIAERLQEIGLLEHFPDELWAQTSAVCMLIDAYLVFMLV